MDANPRKYPKEEKDLEEEGIKELNMKVWEKVGIILAVS